MATAANFLVGNSEAGVWWSTAPDNCGLNVSMRLTGRNVDIILKLQACTWQLELCLGETILAAQQHLDNGDPQIAQRLKQRQADARPTMMMMMNIISTQGIPSPWMSLGCRAGSGCWACSGRWNQFLGPWAAAQYNVVPLLLDEQFMLSSLAQFSSCSHSR